MPPFFKTTAPASALILALFSHSGLAAGELLNVSYDVSRELYKAINRSFSDDWKSHTGEDVQIHQSHGGSSKQVLAVLAGLDADVVTLNQILDIQNLVEAGLVAPEWQQFYPYQSSPYSTTSVFLVRSGNPRQIRDWDDLVRPGVQVILPNPKTSGNGRYSYLSALGFALNSGQSQQQAEAFLQAIFRNVPVLDAGGRAATTTFTQRGIGDVLITFENEALLIQQELADAGFEVIYPSIAAFAEAPVARVLADHGVEEQLLADAYLDFLFTSKAQTIIAQNGFRPSNPRIRAQFRKDFPEVVTFDVKQLLGPWAEIQAYHFADGGLLDRLVGGEP